eukprot:467553_1
MNNELECRFWYWYYSTYFVAGLATISILVTAVLAFGSFCKHYIQPTIEPIKEAEYVKQCVAIIKYYKMALSFCLALLTVSLILSLFSYKYCENNVLQQAFIGSMLVIIGALSYHQVIITLYLLRITSMHDSNKLCKNVSCMVC